MVQDVLSICLMLGNFYKLRKSCKTIVSHFLINTDLPHVQCTEEIQMREHFITHMWDMSRFVMIALPSLHSDKMLLSGIHKLLVMLLSHDLGDIWTYTKAISTFSDVFSDHIHSVTCWPVT